MGTETVTAVISSHNSRAYVGLCLPSLFSQSRPPDEVILVDRGSHDATVDYLRVEYPGVRIIQSRRDPGFAKALNMGIRYATGEYILLLDMRTRLGGGFIEALLAPLQRERNGAVGSTSGKVFKMFRGPNVLDSTGLVFNPGLASPSKRGEGHQDNGHFDAEEVVFGPGPGAAMYRRETIEDVSFQREVLDEKFAWCVDEFDLAWRAQLRGWKSIYVPKATAVGDLRDTPTWSSRDKIRYTRDRVLQMYKNLASKDLRHLFVPAILGELKRLLTSPGGLITLSQIVAHLPDHRVKRQWVRKNRRIPTAALKEAGFERE